MSGPTYERFVEENSKLDQIVPRFVWEYMDGCNRLTKDSLTPLWEYNIRKNLKKLYRKHGSVIDHFAGLGINKAIIAVGAGPSFNINKNILKAVYRANLQYKLDDQPFIIIASNHQFKPLLEMGIYPHFVLLVDGGDNVYDQLCVDIPEIGRNAILLSSIHGSHKVLKEWDRQGRSICFFLNDSDMYKKLYKEIIKKDPDKIAFPQGGNVLITAWLLGMKLFGSSVFMCVGNDLSFKYDPSYDIRKNFF